MDPRNYQIVALSAFVVFGITRLGFQIEWLNAVVIIATAFFTQQFLFEPGQGKSALISSLSLVLLLRTEFVAVAALAAIVAIASKRFLRMDGAHVCNPSAFSLVLIAGLTPYAYLSPGQWGALGVSAFLVVGCGLMVVSRAQRLDVAMAFLLTYLAIVFIRGVYLGDPISIAWHQMQNGALLLFAFFMITDPKTTPVHAGARVLFGVLIAATAAVLQFYFYISTAAIYALVALAPVVIILNFYSRRPQYEKLQKSGAGRHAVRCSGIHANAG